MSTDKWWWYNSAWLFENYGTKIPNLIKTSKKNLKIDSVNKQAGFNDCGVFAAAFCIALVNGQDPSTLVYDRAVFE